MKVITKGRFVSGVLYRGVYFEGCPSPLQKRIIVTILKEKAVNNQKFLSVL